MNSSRGLESKERKKSSRGKSIKRYSDTDHHKDSTSRIKSKEQYGDSTGKRKHHSSDDGTTTSKQASDSRRIKKEDSGSKNREEAVSSSQPRRDTVPPNFSATNDQYAFVKSEVRKTPIDDKRNTRTPSELETEKKRIKKEERLSSNRHSSNDDAIKTTPTPSTTDSGSKNREKAVSSGQPRKDAVSPKNYTFVKSEVRKAPFGDKRNTRTPSKLETEKKRIKKEEQLSFNRHSSNDDATKTTPAPSTTDSGSKNREKAVSSGQPRKDAVSPKNYTFVKSEVRKAPFGDKRNTRTPSKLETEKKRIKKEEQLSFNRHSSNDDATKTTPAPSTTDSGSKNREKAVSCGQPRKDAVPPKISVSKDQYAFVKSEVRKVPFSNKRNTRTPSELKTEKKRIKKEEQLSSNRHSNNDDAIKTTSTPSTTDSGSKNREKEVSSGQSRRDAGHQESSVSKGQCSSFVKFEGDKEKSFSDRKNTKKPAECETKKRRIRKEELSFNHQKRIKKDEQLSSNRHSSEKGTFRELFFRHVKKSKPRDTPPSTPRNWKMCSGNIVCSLSEKTSCCCERLMADLEQLQRSWFSSEDPPIERYVPTPINGGQRPWKAFELDRDVRELLNRMQCKERILLVKEQRKNVVLRKEILSLRARLHQ
uniref:Uncharacterized protein n=1 Tax=Melicertus latisulcatus pemonivirus TaxID=2984278 RepID=A0A9C7CDE5_9VIRU|nr:MAG: hypothetical protein [Melicertus latisulcatus pemonivirus]